MKIVKNFNPIMESISNVGKTKKALREEKETPLVGTLPNADAVALNQHIEDRKQGLERRANPDKDPLVKELIDATASAASRTRHIDVVDRKELAKVLTEAKKNKQKFKVGKSDKLGYRYYVDILPIYGSQGALEVDDDSTEVDGEGSEGALEESLTEDTIKLNNGKYANVGDDGKVDSGTFDTKKEADKQRRAMFANGYKESLDEDIEQEIKDYIKWCESTGQNPKEGKSLDKYYEEGKSKDNLNESLEDDLKSYIKWCKDNNKEAKDYKSLKDYLSKKKSLKESAEGKYTDRLWNALDNGLIDYETVATAAIKWLSDDEIDDLARANDWTFVFEDPEDEDDEDSGELEDDYDLVDLDESVKDPEIKDLVNSLDDEFVWEIGDFSPDKLTFLTLEVPEIEYLNPEDKDKAVAVILDNKTFEHAIEDETGYYSPENFVAYARYLTKDELENLVNSTTHLDEDLKVYTGDLEDFTPSKGAEPFFREIVEKGKLGDLAFLLENVFKIKGEKDTLIDIAALNDLLINRQDYLRSNLKLDEAPLKDDDYDDNYNEEPVDNDDLIVDDEEETPVEKDTPIDSDDDIDPNEVEGVGDEFDSDYTEPIDYDIDSEYDEDDVPPVDDFEEDEYQEYVDKYDPEDKPHKIKRHKEKEEESLDLDEAKYKTPMNETEDYINAMYKAYKALKNRKNGYAAVYGHRKGKRFVPFFALKDSQSELSKVVDSLKTREKGQTDVIVYTLYKDNLDDAEGTLKSKGLLKEEVNNKEPELEIDISEDTVTECDDKDNSLTESIAQGFIDKNFVATSNVSSPLTEEKGCTSKPMQEEDEEVVDVSDEEITEALGMPKESDVEKNTHKEDKSEECKDGEAQ